MRIKTKNLNKLIDKLSGREIDLYLYIIKRQDDFGQVKSLRYKDAIIDLYMPKSTFYYCLTALEKQSFIYINWGCSYGEFDITILDNIFVRPTDYNEGYVKIDLDFILSITFIKLHVNLKKFFMKLLGIQSATRKVRITNELLKQFKVHQNFDELMQIFKITILENAYLFKIKDNLLKKPKNMKFLQIKHKLITYCSKFDISYTTQELIDSVNVIMNYKDKKANRINKALDYIRDKHLLQPALINYMCNC